MAFWRYAARRAAHTAVTLALLLVFMYVLFRLVPGDPTTILLGTGELPLEAQQRLRALWGLDQPQWRQFLTYALNLMQGDLGLSFYYRRPVIEVVWPMLQNTLVLMASGVTMVAAVRAARRDAQPALQRALALTGLLGVIFLVVQGSEWVRLIHHGLTLSAGMYGATFYALIGTHAAHVLGAVVWLAVVGWWAHRGRFAGGKDGVVEACAIYWLFVCALWLALFGLVYR